MARKTSKTTRRKKKPTRHVNARNLWTVILSVLVIIELIGVGVGLIGARMMLKDKPELNVSDFFAAESSHIYDREGNQIADVGTQLRENVTYDELSESIIDCFLAVEDSRYFKHDGFDLPRFIKSALVNVKNVLTHNSAREGGSTFTMQLVKVTYFQNDETGESHAKDIEYKIQQIALARELEQKSNKKAIFEMYLNKLNFGGTGNIRGIEKAAQYYYGKHAGELNLVESAMLAGVINSPYWYDPHNYLDYATRRRNVVLSLMEHHGFITKKEYELAISVPVENTLIDPYSKRSGGRAYAYQSYIDTAIDEAEELTGLDPYTVAMDIYTYMDPNVQQVMDDIQSDSVEQVKFPDDLMEIGMISENNQTGEIIAIGGGRNYGRGGSMLLNHATNQYKQPGSSVKPFLDYALAFEYLGWATSHIVTDKPIVYAGTNIVIKNATNTYVGQLSLEDAVGNSLNTPAIQTLEEVINTAGWQTVVNYITNLGFSQVSEDNFDIGFAIGGSNFTCSAKELMAAHAMLMNGGNYIQPHTISRIVFRNGLQDPIEPDYEPVNVLSPEAAYLAARLMYAAVNGPYYNYMQTLQRGYPVYGKTGTTDWGSEGLQYNIPQGAAKDKWMVSETSQFTNVVWVGYEKGIKDKGTYFSSEKSALNIPGAISSQLISAINDSIAPEAIPQPDGVVGISHVLGTFPYVAPQEGMDSRYITYGLIKRDRASLVGADQAEIATLNSFDASMNNDGSIGMNWTPYPNPEKLVVAPDSMDISLYSSSGGLLVEAWGRRLFDYSWLYGPIRYRARIAQDGSVVAEVSSESEYATHTEKLQAGKDIQVCGYYAYETDIARSNEICVTFQAKSSPITVTPITVPTFEDIVLLDTIINWCDEHHVNMTAVNDTEKAGTYQFAVTDGESYTPVSAGTIVEDERTLILIIYQ